MIGSNISLIKAVCTDAGVIPRMDQRNQDEKSKFTPYLNFNNQFTKNQKQNFYLMVTQGTFNTKPVLTRSIKFCDTCHIFRPPRTIHCNVCDCCIRGFDHHCIWLGTCIGERNYPSFLAVVAILNLALPIAAFVTIEAIIEVIDGNESGNIALGCIFGAHVLCLVIVSHQSHFLHV